MNSPSLKFTTEKTTPSGKMEYGNAVAYPSLSNAVKHASMANNL